MRRWPYQTNVGQPASEAWQSDAQVSQETLAEMIGTTRSRVSFFMKKFCKLGFLEYNGGLHIHSSLLNIVPHD